MEEGKDGIAVKEEITVKETLDLNMEEDKNGIGVKEEITANETLDSTVCSEDFKNYLLEQQLKSTTCFPKYQSRTIARRHLCNKLRSMIEESSTDLEERLRINQNIQTSLKIESEKTAIFDLLKMNRQCSKLRRAFLNRGLPIDKETIQSVAASKDTFDMSSLSASLPSTSNESEDEVVKKTRKLTQEFLAIVQCQKQLMKTTSERLASNDSELNNNIASCSYKDRQPGTLAKIVKNVCADMKKMPLRPVTRIRKFPDSSMSYSPVRAMLGIVPDISSNSNMSYSPVRPMLRKVPGGSSNSTMFYSPWRPMMTEVPDGSSAYNMSYYSLTPPTRIQNDSDCSSNSSINRERISVPEVPEFLFGGKEEVKRLDEERRVPNNPTLSEEHHLNLSREVVPEHCSLFKSFARRSYFLAQRLQQLRNSTLLERQMSRLNITNSRRADIKEAEAESEIELSSDPVNKNQEEVRRAERRKFIRDELKNLLLLYKESKAGRGKELTK